MNAASFYIRLYSLLLLLVIYSPHVLADDFRAMEEQLHLLSITELINLEVTSAAKKAQSVSNTAAAIYVITQEDIHRSGATSFPEILRMVPGINVGRIDQSQWAVSSRGFNGIFVDKLLVLLDGRSIYTPFFGGVFWNAQDTFLEDIERIEVIRGPGATLWGANATNGVINIITKKASDTQGWLAYAGGGDIEQGFGGARYGGTIGDTSYRLYTKYFNRAENNLELGGDAQDDWESVRAGLRVDSTLSERDTLTIVSDGHYTESGWDAIERLPTGTLKGDARDRYAHGANALARWTHSRSETEEIQTQVYYDHIDRDDDLLAQRRDTFDIETQHRFSPHGRHDIVYGAGYRFYQDDVTNTFGVSVEPESRNIDLYTGFIQDEITLSEDLLYLIIGSKLEHNAHSGTEVLPNIRSLYTPTDKHTFWAAVSRAVRSPTRFNEDGRVLLDSVVDPASGLTTVVSGIGDRRFDGENLIAYELGYRSQLADWLSIDIAAFYNDYDDLESFEQGDFRIVTDDQGRVFGEIPVDIDNLLEGETYGLEVTLDGRPTEDWRLVASYSYLNIDLSRKPGSNDTVFLAGEDQTPEHQLHFRSLANLPHNLELDATFRVVSEIDTFNVEGYQELDLRVAWWASEGVELSVVGQNLLDDDRVEFVSNFVDTERTAIRRSIYGRVTVSF